MAGINEGTISNVRVDGTLEANDFLGGLVGKNEGLIVDSHGEVFVKGEGLFTGGLVGSNTGTIRDSSSEGIVNGASVVGGLVGSNSGDIEQSSTRTSVSGMGEDEQVGGLAGSNSGTVTGSVSYGNVTGMADVGGLVARNSGDIVDSRASGNVKNEGRTDGHRAIRTGGLVGWNTGQILESSGTGHVEGEVGAVGGLVGSSDGQLARIESSYSTGNVTSGAVAGGLVGVNGGEIIDSYSTAETVTGTEHVGGLIGDNGYLTSIHGSYSKADVKNIGGEGTAGGLVGRNGAEITDSYSVGDVEGNDIVGGLVGENASGVSSIHRSYSIHESVSGWHVGGLVGDNGGEITESFAVGVVKGRDTGRFGELAGGLAGVNSNSGEISDSYSMAHVTGNQRVGGLVGEHGGTIRNAFSTGTAMGPERGGLVAYVWDNTMTAPSSYWDEGTFGGIGSEAGEGKSTAEMQQQATYNGWETDVWEFPQDDYPDLRHNPRPADLEL